MGCHSDRHSWILENEFSCTACPQTDLFCICWWKVSQVCNTVMTTTLDHPERHVSVCRGASSTDTAGFLFMSVSGADHSRLRNAHLISREESTAGSWEPGYPHFIQGCDIMIIIMMMNDDRSARLGSYPSRHLIINYSRCISWSLLSRTGHLSRNRGVRWELNNTSHKKLTNIQCCSAFWTFNSKIHSVVLHNNANRWHPPPRGLFGLPSISASIYRAILVI